MAFAPPSARPSTSTGEDRSYVGSVKRGVMSRSGSSVLSRSIGSVTSTGSRLTPERMERLREIQHRALLGGTLKQKLMSKYRALLPEDVLAREIDALVLKDRITSDELKTLDAHLREVAAKLGGLTGIPEESSSDALDDLLTHIGSPAHDAPPGSFVPSLARHATEGAVWGSWSEHATTGSKTAASRTASARERDEWTVLAKYDEVVAFNAEQARKQETLKAKAEMREFLAQQMAQRSSTEAATSATEKNVWSKTFAAEVDAAAAEKLRLAEEKRLLGEQQKRTREQQIEFRRAQAEMEARARLEYEQALIDKSLAEARAVEEAAVKKRAERRLEAQRVINENKLDAERRRQIEMAEREQDVRRMQEYAALVEEQERKRKEVFEAFAKKQELLAKQRVEYKPPVVRNVITDEMIRAQEIKKAQEEDEKMRAQEEKRKFEEQQRHRVLAQQLREKEDARAREREAGRAEAAFVRETAERVAAEAAKEAADLKRRAIQHKHDVADQMLADKRKGRDRIEPGMSKEEKAINAAKFEVAFKALEEMGLLK